MARAVERVARQPEPAQRRAITRLALARASARRQQSQVIDPWTLMLRFMNAQFGFININMGKSRDP